MTPPLVEEPPNTIRTSPRESPQEPANVLPHQESSGVAVTIVRRRPRPAKGASKMPRNRCPEIPQVEDICSAGGPEPALPSTPYGFIEVHHFLYRSIHCKVAAHTFHAASCHLTA